MLIHRLFSGSAESFPQVFVHLEDFDPFYFFWPDDQTLLRTKESSTSLTSLGQV